MIPIEELTNVPSEVDVRKEVDNHLLGDLVRKTCNSRPPEWYELMVAHHVYGYTYTELGRSIDRSLERTRIRIARCDRLIRQKFPAEELPFIRYEHSARLEREKKEAEEYREQAEKDRQEAIRLNRALQEKIAAEEAERRKWEQKRSREIAKNRKAWLYFESLRESKEQINLLSALEYCEKNPIPSNIRLVHRSSRWQLEAQSFAWWQDNGITPAQYLAWLTKAMINFQILKFVDPYEKPKE